MKGTDPAPPKPFTGDSLEKLSSSAAEQLVSTMPEYGNLAGTGMFADPQQESVAALRAAGTYVTTPAPTPVGSRVSYFVFLPFLELHQ